MEGVPAFQGKFYPPARFIAFTYQYRKPHRTIEGYGLKARITSVRALQLDGEHDA